MMPKIDWISAAEAIVSDSAFDAISPNIDLIENA
jgi:hypothetical protein